MSLLDVINPLYVASGLGVGFLVGMTGVGGGSLMTPLLILVFRIHPQSAVGTDLLYAAITKSVGTLVHGRKGSVDWRVVARLASGSLPATLVTLAFLSWYGSPSHDTARLISIALGVALLLTAPSVFFGVNCRHGLIAMPVNSPRNKRRYGRLCSERCSA